MHISDPVLVREDGVPLYTLSSAVDDGEIGITHILRGEDHVTNTAVQIQVFQALGYNVPEFGHNALLQMADSKLSKRVGGGEVKALREAGYEPMAVNSLLARLGSSDPIEPFADIHSLIQQFDISKFGRAAANYDEAELERLNEKLLHQLSYNAVAERLQHMGLETLDEPFWLAIRENLKRLADAKDWWEMVYQPITPVIEDERFTQDAAALLPEGTLSEAAYHEWIDRVKVATGRKGKQLFMPIRLALTGRKDGPELPKLFSLLDKKKLSLRLQGETV
jgi:glutamyl-tRNA synthetase